MSIRSALTARIWHLPPRRDAASVERDIPIPARDGAHLLTDVWRPATSDPVSAIVVRSPYGRRSLSLVGELLAERGHLVLLQSCRGTFGSEGSFIPFTTEKTDGDDTLTWLSRQPHTPERVIVVGASYMGYTAYAALSEGAEVHASVMAVTTTDFRRIMHTHGAFGAETALTWIEQLRHQEDPLPARLRRNLTRQRHIRHALAVPPPAADTDLLGTSYPPYQDWLSHPAEDPWWEHVETPLDAAASAPTVQIAGWYDPFLEAQLLDYHNLQSHGQAPRLIIGPWTHGSPALLRTFIEETNRVATTGQVGTGARIHLGGINEWQQIEQWPPTTTAHTYQLTDNGTLDNGTLDAGTGAGTVAKFPLTAATDQVTDLTQTARVAGGRGLNPDFAGRKNQQQREQHPAVFTTTTSPLTEPVTIAGSPLVHLTTSPLAEEHDWFIRLCDVDERGRSWNVCDGFIRIPASTAGPDSRPVPVRLAPTAYTFAAGHRLRLQITSTGQPWYTRATENPGASPSIIAGDPGTTLIVPRWDIPTGPDNDTQ